MKDKKMTLFNTVVKPKNNPSIFSFHQRFFILFIISNFLRLKKFLNGIVPLKSVTARCTNVATFESCPFPPKSGGDCKDGIQNLKKI
jgi:hypothetical protein